MYDWTVTIEGRDFAKGHDWLELRASKADGNGEVCL